MRQTKDSKTHTHKTATKTSARTINNKQDPLDNTENWALCNCSSSLELFLLRLFCYFFYILQKLIPEKERERGRLATVWQQNAHCDIYERLCHHSDCVAIIFSISESYLFLTSFVEQINNNFVKFTEAVRARVFVDFLFVFVFFYFS